jgi:hypothetical protein
MTKTIKREITTEAMQNFWSQKENFIDNFINWYDQLILPFAFDHDNQNYICKLIEEEIIKLFGFDEYSHRFNEQYEAIAGESLRATIEKHKLPKIILGKIESFENFG